MWVSSKKATKWRHKNPDLKTCKEMLLFNICTEEENQTKKRKKTFAKSEWRIMNLPATEITPANVRWGEKEKAKTQQRERVENRERKRSNELKFIVRETERQTTKRFFFCNSRLTWHEEKLILIWWSDVETTATFYISHDFDKAMWECG